ncbi:MAG: oligosaccharide flippase family protein [Candidatus Thiodiazotropha sp. (ex Ctena orbiculata)]|nr:oligosaccharide flippase family protein [Candidatus Thiodiazotropha taylori]
MAKGAFWLFLEKITQQLLSFVVFTIIVAKIGPSEYGLVALCTVIVSLANNTILGMVDSIVSMKIRDDERLSTLFWVVLSIGAFISVFSYFMAGYFASFFEEPKLQLLLQVFSAIPVIYGLAAVPIGLAISSMDFRVFTIRTLVGSLLGGGVGVYLAYNGWGAYAIAVQQIIAQISTVIILYITSSWRPRFIFNVSRLKEMIYLGLGQTSSLLISFLEQHMPRLILGYYIGPTAVGHYAFVRRVIGIIQEGIIAPILNVIYPAISTIIDKPEEQRAIIKQTIFVLGFVIFPIIVGIVFTVPIFVPLLFGDKWNESIQLIQIFAPAVIFLSLNLFVINIFRAHQLIFTSMRIQIIVTSISTLGSLVVAPFGGGAWVLMVQVVSAIVSTIAFTSLLSVRLKMAIWKDYVLLLSPVFASLAMMGPILLVYHTDISGNNISLNLLYTVIVGAITYTAVIAILERKRLYYLVSHVRKQK